MFNVLCHVKYIINFIQCTGSLSVDMLVVGLVVVKAVLVYLQV